MFFQEKERKHENELKRHFWEQAEADRDQRRKTAQLSHQLSISSESRTVGKIFESSTNSQKKAS